MESTEKESTQMGIHHRGIHPQQWPMPPFAGRGRRAHRLGAGRPTVGQLVLNDLYDRAVEAQRRADDREGAELADRLDRIRTMCTEVMTTSMPQSATKQLAASIRDMCGEP
jgi:hypothetical protein